MAQRTILFRGKRLDNGEWIYGGYYLEPYTNCVYIISWNSFGLGFIEHTKVDPQTVGQFIGLYDRKSKQIFEGDILRYYSDALNKLVGDTCAVKYGEFNCTCCDGVYGYEFKNGDIRNYKSYEVIGNIYDMED